MKFNKNEKYITQNILHKIKKEDQLKLGPEKQQVLLHSFAAVYSFIMQWFCWLNSYFSFLLHLSGSIPTTRWFQSQK